MNLQIAPRNAPSKKLCFKWLPQVGEAWRTDELHLKIRGNKRYLFAMLDSETRFWIAKMVAEHKGTDDVRPMFKQAKKVAGKIPTTLISDKAANFHEAWKQQYRAKNFLHKDTWHVNEVAFDGIYHNNQMESFNGTTLRHREKVTRGLKREDSGIITGLRLYHNFVRPHLELPDGLTPAEAAGITIEGDNKILTIIRAAAKSQD
ncbi:MAG: DDE-type integrase/transposase/recombinase [Cenarchaeum sp. SB0661_bin_35]|nr:DDE-type integrase/transposase/recombinase [Cenarchaeum sp. SB0667_bin_13]MYC80132.1 DDE-type integrase/transposase/recombinase [Cenarchaeum sp. SB0661_bin_35]